MKFLIMNDTGLMSVGRCHECRFFYRNKCARKTNKLINHFFLTSPPRHESISQFVVGSGVARAKKKPANKLRINNDFSPFDCATPLVEFMNCIGINCQPRKCYKLITKSSLGELIA